MFVTHLPTLSIIEAGLTLHQGYIPGKVPQINNKIPI